MFKIANNIDILATNGRCILKHPATRHSLRAATMLNATAFIAINLERVRELLVHFDEPNIFAPQME